MIAKDSSLLPLSSACTLIYAYFWIITVCNFPFSSESLMEPLFFLSEKYIY